LCLCVPLYPVFYMLSRWRETRGIFAMSFAPLGVVILFALFGGYVIGLKGPTTFFDKIGERLDSLVPEVAPRVDSARLAVAERLCREYIQAMRSYTDELSRIQSIAPGQLNRSSLDAKGARMDSAEWQVQSFKLAKNELTALKSSIGAEMRSAIIALKYELTRLDSLPRLRGQFGAPIARLDRLLSEWEAPTDVDAGPQLAEASPPTFVAPSPGPSGLPPSGRPSGIRPGGMQPGMPRHVIEDLDTHYNRLRSQYGDRAVMVVLSGLPTNSDTTRGVTKRDVEDAIDKRLKALAPESHQSMSTGSGAGRTMCIAPVDDVKGLAERIDFGKASLKGSRIDVAVSGTYIASVPRLPAEPSVAARRPSPREKDPEIPAEADPITKSLIQLKSTDIFRKKDALQRLTRVKPTNKQKEVLEAILPLLDHDDEDLVKHAVRVLAVWQSPEALAKLSELVNDSRVFLRWEIIKALGKYDEPKAAEALIERLKDDGHQAEEALKSMGAIAEPPLIALLRNPDADLRKKACEVLKFVGGAATLKAMKAIPRDPEFFVRVAAQDAIKMINLRVGPPAPDSPDTKKNATPPPGKTKKKS
jgi:HEAT repeat protein